MYAKIIRGLLPSLLIVTTSVLALQPLTPTDTQSGTLQSMIKNLQADHYRKRDINDDFSAELFDGYLDALDPSKSFFLKKDIDALSREKLLLDDQLDDGSAKFGFSAFERYREIASLQMQKNIDLLESDIEFNLGDQEVIASKLDDRNAMESALERDNWWRLRTEDALIRMMLGDKDRQEARKLLTKRYKMQLRHLREMDERDIFQIYCNSIAALYDPHTSYLSPRTSENFNINMSLSLEGIGAVLTRDEDYTKVVRVVVGGPADKQGQLKAGDKITGVAQGKDSEIIDIVGARLDDAVDKIRGPKDSIVRLEVIPSKSSGSTETSKIIEIKRDKVKLEEQAAKSELIKVNSNDQTYHIGVIDVPTFYFDFEAYRNGNDDPKRTSADVAKLLQDLSTKNIDGVILDLRGNGGGSLHEATAMTDLFVNPGPVVQIRHSNKRIDRRQSARRPAFYNGPLVVLIDRLSASASEILAGALQDYGRAIVVGSQSFGKGTVQNLISLDEGQLKFTESKFYRISGESTQHRGIVPDITFPSDHILSEIGESNEENALPWDTIKPASYKALGNLELVTAILKREHKQRISTNPDFIYIEERNKLSKHFEQEDKKGVSLVFNERKSLKDTRQEQALSLENKRRIAKSLQPYSDVQAWQDALDGSDEESGESEALSASVNDEQTNSTDKKDDRPLDERDPRLLEAGHILVDMVKISRIPNLANQY